jgi:pimeloyl-ACP methyl ester carboxylesterase
LPFRDERREVTSEPPPIVLVPGACLGGWVWGDVARSLRAKGHEVFPVTLTGLGERVHLARPEVGLDVHNTDVVNLLDFEALEGAVLVGHSYAGVVVTGVADRRPERLSKVVYLDTGPLPDGTAIVDVQSAEQREQQRAAIERDGEGWRWPPPDRDVLASGLFGSTSGLDERHFRLFEERGTAQPYATFTTPLRLSGRPAAPLRRAAILCSAGALDLATARDLIARGDPRLSVFAGPEWELHELPTGHWAMLSSPGPLADLLHEIAA